MDALWIMLLVVLVVALVLRRLRPTWYWMTFGVTLATIRVLSRYRSVMDACGLTVPPSRWRLTLARLTNRPPRRIVLRASCGCDPPRPAWSSG